MAEFHFDDQVINTKTGRAFVVKGMMKSATAGVLYSGEDVGWTPEEDLDYNMTAMQKEELEPVEHMLHTLRSTASDLTAKLVLLKADWGILPRPVVVEIEAVILMLRSHVEL